MNDLMGKPGELRATIEIKRAATGKIETYELIGHHIPEAESKEGKEDGGNALNSSS